MESTRKDEENHLPPKPAPKPGTSLFHFMLCLQFNFKY